MSCEFDAGICHCSGVVVKEQTKRQTDCRFVMYVQDINNNFKTPAVEVELSNQVCKDHSRLQQIKTLHLADKILEVLIAKDAFLQTILRNSQPEQNKLLIVHQH